LRSQDATASASAGSEDAGEDEVRLNR